MLGWAIRLVEKGVMPDFLTRIGIRMLLKNRLEEEQWLVDESGDDYIDDWVKELSDSPIALFTGRANEQHYEVPPEFFQLVLGSHLKYSSCYYPDGIDNIVDAEVEMLKLTYERAGIEGGMDILELGCGWGSLTLWMADNYSNSRIVAVSNSNPQREFIQKQAETRNLKNIKIITSDMKDFDIDDKFDRIVSVEMFEHMRNYRELMRRISGWLKSDGKLFVHIFCHREYVYPFEATSEDDWMSTYFFTGGLMPSYNLLPQFNEDLKLEQRWKVNGNHYARTCHHWLKNQDENKNAIMEIFERTYGKDQAAIWWNRWRIFFMSCEELFRYNDGNEWFVAHYLFKRR